MSKKISYFVISALLWCGSARASGAVTIEHTAVSRATRGTEIIIRATIRAPAGVYLPMLFHRVRGSSEWISTPMERSHGDEYVAAIPGISTSADLDYYIEAYDANLAGPARSGDREHPHAVSIIEPSRALGRITVETSPSGATVRIDGEAAGVAPFRATVTPGRHVIAVWLRGYSGHERAIDVAEGETVVIEEMLAKIPAASPRVHLVERAAPHPDALAWGFVAGGGLAAGAGVIASILAAQSNSAVKSGSGADGPFRSASDIVAANRGGYTMDRLSYILYGAGALAAGIGAGLLFTAPAKASVCVSPGGTMLLLEGVFP